MLSVLFELMTENLSCTFIGRDPGGPGKEYMLGSCDLNIAGTRTHLGDTQRLNSQSRACASHSVIVSFDFWWRKSL